MKEIKIGQIYSNSEGYKFSIKKITNNNMIILHGLLNQGEKQIDIESLKLYYTYIK